MATVHGQADTGSGGAVTGERSMRILVIQNDPTCPPGRFDRGFERAGVAVDLRRGFAGDDIPAEARGVDGVIVLGGAMGANDAALHSWLLPVQELIRSTVQGEVPFLGICLGMQLAAVALGGEVAINPNGRRAAGLVRVAPAPDDDPLLGRLSPGLSAIQWNDDVVRRLPPRSVVLAQSPDGTPQAIRFGPAAWGVQFHPEATPDIFRSWLDEPGANAAAERAAWRAVTEADDRLQALGDVIGQRFVALCRTARPAAERTDRV
jgi:GMP synthase (glutamine-hydrolysing)